MAAVAGRDPGLVPARCQRNGCTAEVLVGRGQHGTTLIVNQRSVRLAVLHLVPTQDLNGEFNGMARRLVYEDAYTPHRYTCTGKDSAPETGDPAS